MRDATTNPASKLSTLALTASILLAGCGAGGGGGATGSAAAARPTSFPTLDLAAVKAPAYAETPFDYLGAKYARLVVEVSYDTAEPPAASILAAIREKIAPRMQAKDVAFKVAPMLHLTADGTAPTRAQLDAAEVATRSELTGAGTITLHILWLDEPMLNYAGLEIGPSSFAVLAAPSFDAAQQRDILVHETGHILGLVSNGIPVQDKHHVAADQAHCNTAGCVMSPVLGQGHEFCAACIEDLTACGGR